jgi:diguanylate cyclase (GGDEF)-like protein
VLTGDRFAPVGRGLPESAIPDQGIASNLAGELFVGTPEGLFVARGDGPFRQEPPLDPKGLRQATGLHVTRVGGLIFARGGRLFQRSGNPAHTVEIGRSLGLPDGEPIDQTATDGAGWLWVRTLTQLWGLPPAAAGAERRFERADAGLAEGVASGRLALDEHRRILVPTSQGLAFRQEDGTWGRIGRREGLASDTVLSALVDREGSLWIGLAGSGLAQQLGRGAFTTWGTPEGMSHDVVWSVVRQRTANGAGPLWAGTEEGLDRIEGGKVRIYREEDGLAGNTVYTLAAGPDGSVWAGSWPGGVTRFGPDGSVRRYLAEGLAPADFKVISLYFDRAGQLWVGARTGIYRLEAGSAVLKPVRLPGWDERDSVYGFAEDRAGILYAVGRYGLQRLTGPSPRRFRQADGLLSDFLAAVTAAGPDEPWDLIVGYREALGGARIRIEGDRLRIAPLDRSTGLSFDKVLFLGRDAAGALWVGGGAGVDVFRRPAPERPVHFGRVNGLVTEDMSQNAVFPEADGTVWIGTSRGLVRYRPGRREQVAPAAPPILLTAVTAGERRLDPRGGTDRVVLERDERDLTVTWASPTFLDPARVRFRYRLAGLEAGFHETAAQEVRFPALPTGRYRLEVTAVSGDGSASPRPAVLEFAVRPAWWERPWAWAAGLLLLGFAVAGAVRLRTRALEADRERLERAVDERSTALARAVQELQEVSTTDFLTGMRNRRYLNSVIDADLARAVRAHAEPSPEGDTHGRDLLVYLVDIDHFKSVNDRYGHHVGDLLLVEVSRRLQGVVRASDLLVRWGGEELLILARGADRAEGGAFAGRILSALGDRPCELDDSGHITVIHSTGSVGWAPYPWFPDEPEALTFEQVLTLADHALYLAKRSGRDRAVGAMALALAAEAGPRAPGWWQQPLAEAEGRWVRLVRTARNGSGQSAAGGAA